jgi:hypothetical protein
VIIFAFDAARFAFCLAWRLYMQPGDADDRNACQTYPSYHHRVIHRGLQVVETKADTVNLVPKQCAGLGQKARL